MGWMIPKYKYYISAIRLWNKIFKMEAEHLTRKIFEWSYRDLDVCSWSNIYDIFESVNKLENFEMAEELDINDLEIKLADIMHNEWSNKLPSNQN